MQYVQAAVVLCQVLVEDPYDSLLDDSISRGVQLDYMQARLTLYVQFHKVAEFAHS